MPAEEDEKRHTRQCMLSEMPRLHRTNNNNNNKDTRNSSSVSQSVGIPQFTPSREEESSSAAAAERTCVCDVSPIYFRLPHRAPHTALFTWRDTNQCAVVFSEYMLFQPSSLNPIQQLPPAIAFNNSTSAEEIDRQAATTTAGKCGGNPRKATIFLCWWRMSV